MTNTGAHSRRDPWPIAFLCLLGAMLALDIGYFLLVSRPDSLLGVPMADSTVYLQLAEELRSGGAAAHSVFYWSPLYTVLLALLTRFGAAPVILLQLAAGLGTLGLVFVIASRQGSSRAGFFAALVLALYAPFLMQQTKLVPVTFAVLFSLIGIGLTLHAMANSGSRTSKSAASIPHSASRIPHFVSGLCFGAAGLLMPQLLLAPVLVGFHLLFGRDRSRGNRILLLAAGVLVAVLPITIRNAVVGHDFVPVSSSAGYNLYLGFHPNGTGLIGRPREMTEFTVDGRNLLTVKEQEEFQRRFAEQELGHELKPSAVSGFWARRSLKFITQQPGRALRQLVNKLEFSLTSYEFANSYYPEIERALAWPLKVAFLPWALLFGLAIASIVLTWPRRSALWPLYVLPLAVLISLLLFFVNSRYRLPAVPPMAILAGLGIDAALKDRRRRLAGAGIALLAIVISGPVLRAAAAQHIRFDEAYGWRNFNINAQRLGHDELALNLLDRSTRLMAVSPRGPRTAAQYDDLAQAYLALGNRFLDRKNPVYARRAYDSALQMTPVSPRPG